MKGERALITVRRDWLSLGYHMFVSDHPPTAIGDDFILFSACVLDVHSPHGLFIKSDSKDAEDAKARFFIPWKYIEGIMWSDDPNASKRRLGFGDKE